METSSDNSVKQSSLKQSQVKSYSILEEPRVVHVPVCHSGPEQSVALNNL